jgi:energy-coupling factor transport system permease protein
MQPIRVLGNESFIHRLSPLTKLFAVVLFMGTALVTFNWVPLAMMVLVALILWVIARLDLRNLWPVFTVTFGVAVLMITFNGFFFYNGKTPMFYVFGHPFWYEGMLFGGVIVLKIFAVVTIVPILLQTTPMPNFMAGLSELKLPYKVVFTFGMAFRLVPLIGSTYKDITEAQTLRGHDLKRMNVFKKLLRGYIPLFVPLVLTLLRRSADLDIAIESRGFGAPVKRSTLVDIGMTWRDAIFLILFIAAFLFIVWYSFFGGGINMYRIVVGGG